MPTAQSDLYQKHSSENEPGDPSGSDGNSGTTSVDDSGGLMETAGNAASKVHSSGVDSRGGISGPEGNTSGLRTGAGVSKEDEQTRVNIKEQTGVSDPKKLQLASAKVRNDPTSLRRQMLLESGGSLQTTSQTTTSDPGIVDGDADTTGGDDSGTGGSTFAPESADIPGAGMFTFGDIGGGGPLMPQDGGGGGGISPMLLLAGAGILAVALFSQGS